MPAPITTTLAALSCQRSRVSSSDGQRHGSSYPVCFGVRRCRRYLVRPRVRTCCTLLIASSPLTSRLSIGFTLALLDVPAALRRTKRHLPTQLARYVSSEHASPWQSRLRHPPAPSVCAGKTETRDGIRSARCAGAAGQCAPLHGDVPPNNSPASRQTYSSHASYVPAGLPTFPLQKFNAATNSILEAAGVPLLRLHQRTAACWDLHTDCAAHVQLPDSFPKAADCTHWPFPSPVIEFANRRMLHEVERRCAIIGSSEA